MAKLIEIEGVGEAMAAKLEAAGIKSIDQLLAQGASPKGRKEIAEKSGIDEAKILKWVNFADLFRIKGVASEYSELLEAAGVDTVAELAKRNAENLHEKIMAVNAEKKLVRRPPTASQVADWVEQAKKLPRAVNY